MTKSEVARALKALDKKDRICGGFGSMPSSSAKTYTSHCLWCGKEIQTKKAGNFARIQAIAGRSIQEQTKQKLKG